MNVNRAEVTSHSHQAEEYRYWLLCIV